MDDANRRQVKGAKQLAVVGCVRYGRGSTSVCGGVMEVCETGLCVIATSVQEHSGEPLDCGVRTRDARSFHMLTVVRNTKTGKSCNQRTA